VARMVRVLPMPGPSYTSPEAVAGPGEPGHRRSVERKHRGV